MKCATEEQLEQFLSAVLDDKQNELVSTHIDSCPECQSRLDRICRSLAMHSTVPADENIRINAQDALRDAEARFQNQRSEDSPTVSPQDRDCNQDDQPSQASLQIDGLEIIRKLGAGGMGVVYEAQQPALNRRVAVKEISASIINERFRKRFLRETRLLAASRHPHVAQLFDAGTTAAGTPWLVMEFIAGRQLTDFCQEEKLGIERRLRLFLQLCDAVQYLHTKQIIHRDLKPGNVLVTLASGEASVKLIDFGLARPLVAADLEEVELTQPGELAGTPRYMSPEQTDVSPDHQTVFATSDVYALGVILFELFTGDTPIRADEAGRLGYYEILRRVREEEVPRPSEFVIGTSQDSSVPGMTARQLSQRLRDDLDGIILKATEKSADRRYQSVEALAEDIRRSLAHLPTIAGRPGWRSGLRKFVRRNRALVVSVMAVMLVLTAGLCGTTWFAFKAFAAEKQASQKADAEERAKEELAKKNNHLVSSQDALTSLLMQMDPRAQGPKPESVSEFRHRQLNTALELVDREDFASGEQRMQLYLAAGQALSGLGYAHDALDPFRKSLRLAKQHFPSDATVIGTAATNYAGALTRTGNPADALSVQQETAEQLQNLAGPFHPFAIALRAHTAHSLNALGRTAEAVPILQAVIADADSAGLEDGEVLDFRMLLVNLLTRLKRHSEALQLVRKLVPLYEQVHGQNHSLTFRCRNNLAILLSATGQGSEALQIYQEIAAAAVLAYGEDSPQTLQYRLNTAVCQLKNGDPRGGLREAEDVVAVAESVVGSQYGFSTRFKYELGKLYIVTNRLPDAIQTLQDVIKVQNAYLSPDHPERIAAEKELKVARSRLEKSAAKTRQQTDAEDGDSPSKAK